MYTFIICVLTLILSYFAYGKLVERIAGVDDKRETPAFRLRNDVDYTPLSTIKNFLIHFLNIAGLGPIFGAIQGALFGPAAFLWIVFGTIFIGAVHDFFSGFMSLRNDGLTMPKIIEKYMGKNIQRFVAFVIIITGVLVGAVFSTGAAELLSNLTHVPIIMWTVIIFIYFLIATVFPVNKIIARVYPIFGALFFIMSITLIGALILNPAYTIPEFTTKGMYLTTKSIFPYLFITIACGAISGFHASQAPIVARCIENEEDARPVFFGAMVLEGLVALCWAAIAMAFFHGQPQLAVLYSSSPSIAVNEISLALIGSAGLVLTVIGVVICPITTGDTSLRSSRITLADEFNINQDKLISRLKLTLPLFLASFALTFINFTMIWRYFAWLQLIIGVAVLFTATAYLIEKEKQYLITLLPAAACTLIAFGYILQAPEGLALPSLIANVIAVILTLLITGVFLKKYKYT